jgi:hypothetical protein
MSWTPATESEIYTDFGQKPTARSDFSKRRVISTPGFADEISRERFELICKFLHFIDESLPTYQGPSILFKIYPVLYHLNINFHSVPTKAKTLPLMKA